VRATAAGETAQVSLGGISNALAAACPMSPLIWTFRKPTPDMPPHGYARKSFTVKARCAMPTEVANWLKTYSKKYEERESSPRAHTLRTEMLTAGGLVHTCTDGSRDVQDEGKLFNWLKRRYTYQKAAGIHLATLSSHAQEVRLQRGEIRPSAGTGISGGFQAGWSDCRFFIFLSFFLLFLTICSRGELKRMKTGAERGSW
jgi:hypothetical protein